LRYDIFLKREKGFIISDSTAKKFELYPSDSIGFTNAL
jgi:hypothetical protein